MTEVRSKQGEVQAAEEQVRGWGLEQRLPVLARVWQS
jgi:hypothetical protein